MSRTYLLDLAERAAVTFIEAFLAVILPAMTVASFSSLSSLRALGLAGAAAGIGAGLSVIKSGLAGFVGDPNTASLLPATTAPQVVRRYIAETVVEGKRLGRHVAHDVRSLLHQLPKSDPPTTAIEWPRRIPILDQGQLGSCTGNATVGALGTDPDHAALEALLAAGLTLDEAEAVLIYSAAEKLDGGKGYPPEDDGSSGLSVAKTAKAMGLIAGYLHCTSIAACFTAIKTGPFIVGTNWLTGMDTPDKTGLVHATGTVRGGHEYLCRGYDPATDRWKFDNSWGTSFGVAGSFFYTTADFTKLLAAQGDATVLLPLTTPPVPTPTPAPSPTPDGSYVEVTDPGLVAHLEALAAKSGETADAFLAARLHKLYPTA